MTSVILHGRLGKKFGKHHKFLIKKPIDAIKALMANKKGFYKAFKTWGREGKIYQVICDGKTINDENEMLLNNKVDEIHICPIIAGAAEKAGIFQTIVGALLIVAGAIVGPGNPVGAALINAGIAMVVGGVMAMLFPPPTPTFESNVQSKSFLFSSTENSAVQGVPVPIGYGRLRIGSKVISTSLSPKRIRGSGGGGIVNSDLIVHTPPGVYSTDVGYNAGYYNASNLILDGYEGDDSDPASGG